MATKQRYKTTFEVDQVIQPFFTGGSVSLDNGATLLATSLGEDAVLTNLTTGKQLTKIEGVRTTRGPETISLSIIDISHIGWRANFNISMCVGPCYLVYGLVELILLLFLSLPVTPSASHLIICSRSLSMRIYSLNVSPDFETVETALARTLKPHSTPVVVLAVDRTGTLAGTGAADGNVKVWDVAGGYVTHSFRGPSVLISALHFFEVAADEMGHGKAISKKHKKGRRDVEDHEEPEDPGSATVNFRLASGSQDGKVRVWDLHKRTTIANLDSHVSDVRGLDYSAKQHALVTAGRDKTIIWWDSRTWKPRKVVPSFELIEAAGFLDDGRLTFSAGENGYIRIWETDSGREVTTEQPARSEEEAMVGAVYNARHSMLLCIQMDHTLALYQAPPVFAKSEVIPQISPLRPLRRIYGTHDDVIDLAYLLPDSSLLALATNSEYVRIVSAVDSPDVLAESATPCHFGQDVALLSGHQDIVLTLDVDWSGHWLATGAKDHTARLWRVDPENNSYTCFAVFTGHAQSVGAVTLPKTRPPESSPAFSDPLSHPPPFLVTGSQDQTIKRWEVPRTAHPASKKASGALFTRKAHDKDINAVDVNSTSHLFASASQDRTVKIWSVQEGEVQGILRGHKRGVWTVKFAPAGTPVVQGEDGSVSGRGLVLTGSGDKTVKLWSLGDYSCLRTFEGHSNSVLKVAWLCLPGQGADKQRQQVQVASAAGDGLVKVWDAATGEVECTLDNHTDRVWALAVQPRTNALVSGSGDSTVTFWRDTSSATQAAAAEAALRLVEQEQLLENHVHAGSYRDAIALALQLNHPARLLALFARVAASDPPDPGSLTGLRAVDDVLASLADDQIFLLLLRLRDWNANARSAPVAQRVLAAIVRSYPAARLSRLSVRGARGQRSLRDVLNALRVYTERHYKRMDELVDESYLVEYTLREMDALAPALESTAGVGDGADVIMVE